MRFTFVTRDNGPARYVHRLGTGAPFERTRRAEALVLTLGTFSREAPSHLGARSHDREAVLILDFGGSEQPGLTLPGF